MFSSDAVTRKVRVQVTAEYAPERSRPADHHWFFLYTITITNEGDETVQLVTRHWIITDGNNNVEEVKGPGVVGEQPVLSLASHSPTPRDARSAHRSA
jgi:ApaG protein